MSALNTVLLLIHLLIALALIGVVLLQRSEGGALGMGGGGGGGFMTGRGTANLLTRVTATLAVCFFATSLLLTKAGQRNTSTNVPVFDRPASTAPGNAPTAPSTPEPAPAAPSGGILDKLK